VGDFPIGMFIFGLFPPIFWILFVGYVALWYRAFAQGRGGYWLFRDYGWLTALYAASEGFVFNPPGLPTLSLLLLLKTCGSSVLRGTT